MEMITTFGLSFFFLLLYIFSRDHNDWIIEYMAGIGFIIVGILMWGTGVQTFTFGVTKSVITSDIVTNIQNVTNNYGVLMQEVPAVNAIGWLFFGIGVVMLLITYKGMIETKKEINSKTF